MKPFLLSSNICNPGVVGVPWYLITELRGGGGGGGSGAFANVQMNLASQA